VLSQSLVGQDRPIAYAKFYAKWNKIIAHGKRAVSNSMGGKIFTILFILDLK